MPPFEYKPFVNPYIGSISELMGKGDEAKAAALIRIGEIQARAAEQRGQAWGNAIQGLGDIASKIPGQLEAQKDRDFQLGQRNRMLAGQQREDTAKALADTIGSTPDTQGLRYVNVPGQPATLDSKNLMPTADGTPATLSSRQGIPTISNPYKDLATNEIRGLNLWKIEEIRAKYAQAGLGLEAQPYIKMYEDSNAGMVKHHESALATAREDASRLMQIDDYGAMMSQAKDLIPKYEANGVFSQRNLDAFKSQLASIEKIPEQDRKVALQSILRNISGVPEEEYTLNSGDVRMRGKEPIAENLRSATPVTLVGRPFERQNPTTGKPELVQSFSDGSLKPVGKPVPPTQAAGGFRFLKGSKGDVIEWPTTQRAPEGYRPYDAVAERQAGASDGTPSPYALERETRTLNSVDELLLKVNRFTVGYGSLLDKVPESDANAFASELQTLKANIAFNELTAMREASKTGGALGNVSNIELALLESALGALNTRQKPKQMVEQLEKIKASITRWQAARALQTNTPVVLNPSDDAMNAAAAAMIAKAKAATKLKEGK